MTKKTRFIILIGCAIIFFVITPFILLFSLGYRADFKNLNIVATGGIYIKALPQEVNIIVDSSIHNTTKIFSNDVFLQNLLPGIHTVAITKNGYYNYQKNLPVQENEVTKLEHVILFKKNIAFSIVKGKTILPPIPKTASANYLIKNNNLYYATPALPTQTNVPIIKNIIAYTVLSGNIIYLGEDGFLYQYSLANQQTALITKTAFLVDKKNTYRVIAASHTTVLQENRDVLVLNPATSAFEKFYSPVNEFKISPDTQKILFYNDNQILVADAGTLKPLLLNTSSEKITDAYWLNNDYVIYNAGGSISISEVDVRGNVNTATLPDTLILSDGTNIITKNSQMYFNQQDKKLYLLTGNLLVSSEKLVP